MGEGEIGRRQLLQGAGVAGGVAVAGVAATAMPAAADGGGRGGITGSWLVRARRDGGDDELTSVLSFAGGDVFVLHDISPAGPPFTGTWERRRHRGFRATVWTGFPGETGPGSAGQTVRVRLRGEVDRGRLTGTFTVAFFDPGGEAAESFDGTFRGRRIEA